MVAGDKSTPKRRQKMANLNNQETVAESHHQAQDSPGREGSPGSIQFILPPVAGAPKGVTEKRWRDILLILSGIGVDVELLLIKSTATGKGRANRITPAVSFVVNKADPAALTPAQAFDVINSLFPNQMTTRAGSQAPWICVPSTANAADVIRNNVENLRGAHRAGLTSFSRAVWYRIDETGGMKRASIDLSKAPGPIRFRTVTEKKQYGKTPALSRAHKKPQKKIEMSSKSEQEKLMEDIVAAIAEEYGRIATGQNLMEILREASVLPVPSTMEEILQYSITGLRSFHDEMRAQTAEREATSPSRGEGYDG